VKINNKVKERSGRTFGLFAVLLFLLVILLTLPYGCKKSSKPARTKKAVQPAQQVVEVAPELPAPEKDKDDIGGYVYNRRERRDPFKPLIEAKGKATGAGIKTTGTLESYDISDFTVQGIARKGGQYLALLQSPDNKSFTVNKGLSIGFNNGMIVDITPNEVITKEEFTDPFGNLKSRQIILELHKGEE
jgi:type IV pilus assembly protein PilP